MLNGRMVDKHAASLLPRYRQLILSHHTTVYILVDFLNPATLSVDVILSLIDL